MLACPLLGQIGWFSGFTRPDFTPPLVRFTPSAPRHAMQKPKRPRVLADLECRHGMPIWNGHGTREALFTFGLVADVQAGDKPDGSGEGRCQRFSSAPYKLGLALDAWLAQRSSRRTRHSRPPVGFVLSLGDIVDGRDDETTTLIDLQEVNQHLHRLPDACPAVQLVGNHCLKFLPRARLMSELGLRACYYRRDVADGWSLLVLDTTDLSTHGGWEPGSSRILQDPPGSSRILQDPPGRRRRTTTSRPTEARSACKGTPGGSGLSR